MKRSKLLWCSMAIALAGSMTVAPTVRAEDPLPPPSSVPSLFDAARLLGMIDFLVAKVDASQLPADTKAALRSSLLEVRAQIAAGEIPTRAELEALAEQIRVALMDSGVTLPSIPVTTTPGDPQQPLPPDTPGLDPEVARAWVLTAIDRAEALLRGSQLPTEVVDRLVADLEALRADVEAGNDVREQAAALFQRVRDAIGEYGLGALRPPSWPDRPADAAEMIARVAARVEASPLPERVKEIILGHLDDLATRIENAPGDAAAVIEEYRRMRFESVRTRLGIAVDHVEGIVDRVEVEAGDDAAAAIDAARATIADLRAELEVATTIDDLRSVLRELIVLRAELVTLLAEPTPTTTG